MKLLVVAWYFPPANTIAAVRVGRLAAYLAHHGHEVNVVSARDLPFAPTLPLEIPAHQVAYTRWIDVRALPAAAARLVRTGSAPRANAAPAPDSSAADAVGGGRPSVLRRVAGRLSALYANAVTWPDPKIGWLPYAVRAGGRFARSRRPDIILATGPPFTTFLIGRRLSRRWGAPWVAEFRDRWSDDPYYPPPAWRRALNRAAERRLVRSAAGIVTVSEPWAETYRRKYGKPVAVVYNGFDREALAVRRRPDDDRGTLRIVYTGGIYPGRRDPTPLFRAMASLGPEDGRVRVEFHGTEGALVRPLAEACGVGAHVTVHPEVPHDQILQVQRDADVLLLLQWTDPREQGNLPGKFFEYLGARRPILVLGLENGVPARIVRERGAGVFGGGPEAIAAHLRTWLQTKARAGEIPDLPESVTAGFARDEQYERMERFLLSLLAK